MAKTIKEKVREKISREGNSTAPGGWLIDESVKETLRLVFEKFDEFACIKDDGWYKEFKETEGVK